MLHGFVLDSEVVVYIFYAFTRISHYWKMRVLERINTAKLMHRASSMGDEEKLDHKLQVVLLTLPEWVVSCQYEVGHPPGEASRGP